ncbi:MAG: hypothetical protein HQL86_06675 [Magnetococcales bacterium]|nr:hypothetical protein [Magnetococcales bacterium]
MPQIPESVSSIADQIANFVLSRYVTVYNTESLPRDSSLIELQVIDSYGMVELISFLEETWSIVIDDSDITKEKMGSINKMASIVIAKISPAE